MEEGFGGVFPLEQGLKSTVYYHSLALHIALPNIKCCPKQGKILQQYQNLVVKSSTKHNLSSIVYLLKLGSLSNGSLGERYQGFRI
jgi:hypothetical protein